MKVPGLWNGVLSEYESASCRAVSPSDSMKATAWLFHAWLLHIC